MPHVHSVTKSRPRRFAVALLALALGAPAAASASDGNQLSGESLRAFIGGKRIYLAVPLGGEIPLSYRKNGVVDGSGEAAGLGKYMTPKDRGRWWVAGDRLCQQWQEWYDGRTFCFTVRKLSGNRIQWVRDDGKRGVARVR